MTKEKLYKYIGYNGTITSKVLLPGIANMPHVRLCAAPGHYLQRGNIKYYTITVPEDEVDLWTEVEGVIV
jgi:hypothetical protein